MYSWIRAVFPDFKSLWTSSRMFYRPEAIEIPSPLLVSSPGLIK